MSHKKTFVPLEQRMSLSGIGSNGQPPDSCDKKQKEQPQQTRNEDSDRDEKKEETEATPPLQHAYEQYMMSAGDNFDPFELEEVIENAHTQWIQEKDTAKRAEIVLTRKSSDSLPVMSTLTKTEQKRRRKAKKQIKSKPAWLSVETTLEDVDVKQQSFTIEGWMALFWKERSDTKSKALSAIFNDNRLQSRIQKLRDDRIKMYQTMLEQGKKSRKEVIEEMEEAQLYEDYDYKLSSSNKIIPEKHFDPYTDKLFGWQSNKDDGKDDGKETKDDNQPKLKHIFQSIQHYGKRKDIFLKFTKDGIQKLKEDGYRFPFYWSSSNRQFQIFRNEIEYVTIGETGIELEYNYDHKVFKLHIHFRAKLYECFENNYNDFPFEWQFLNAQLLLNIPYYAFKAKVPDFVKHAFVFDDYWSGSTFVWKHAMLARKRENIDEWKLLSPWMDLRNDDWRWEDYFHQYHFSLIKFRVVRNPNYYLSYIIVPLFLMVCCAFAAFFIEADSDRLAYIVTLLLTVAAFQISVSTDLPYESQFTLIDKYFLLAYYVLALLVLESGIAKAIVDDYDVERRGLSILDGIFGGICGCMWFLYSLKYLGKWIYFERLDKEWSDIWRKFRNSAFFCCACKAWCCDNYENKNQPEKKRQFEYWLKMAMTESSQWDRLEEIKSKSEKAEVVYGTKGDIMIRDVIDGEDVERYYEVVVDGDTGEDMLCTIENEKTDDQQIIQKIDYSRVHGDAMHGFNELTDPVLKWKHQFVDDNTPNMD